MKLPSLILFFVLPLALLACATSVAPASSGTGGQTGAGGDATGGAGGALTTTSTSTGTSGPCTKKEDCTGAGDACNTGNCINGECGKTPANEGTGCDDGAFCTDNDVCENGTCVGGTPKFCPSPDSCHLGQCDEAIKGCGAGIPGNDGAPCNDNDACTNTGKCNVGVCEKGSPIDCSFLDGPCSKGACDVGLGCIVEALGDGAACNDNLFCTVNDVCDAGMCKGVQNTCAAPGNTCMIGTCNEAQKSCVAVPGNEGMMCDDQNGCTVGSSCANGNCIGGVPANDGAACDDSDACTSGTKCAGGICTNPAATISQCISNDACCPPGCVAQGDGDCSLTKWSEGTQAWPDQACNPDFSFGGCNTNAQDHADAWATAVCQLNGFSLGIWTGNKAPGCNGDISMWCGDMIPCGPIYENQCAIGDQTKVELTCFP